jgi:hypothetical protein
MFRQGFTCLALLDFTLHAFSHTGLSPTMAGLSRTVLLKHKELKGYSAFARHYLRNLG